MRVGSICTGYGGLGQALTLAGINHTLEWVSEIDPGACKVLETRLPDAPNIGDINNATPGPVELITAGFPCQDISNIGQRKGLDGERSGLWWRIKDVIGYLRPGHVILENVAAIAYRGGPAVIGSLTELGYDSRWTTLQACDVGSPHERNRWFCVARDTQSVGRDVSSVAGPGEHRKSERPFRGPDRYSGGRTAWGKYASAMGRWETIVGRPPPAPSEDGRYVNPKALEWMMGLPQGWVTEVDIPKSAQIRCLGNGVVPQQAAQAIRNLTGGNTK